MAENLLLLTDSYKASHWKQYPPKTEKVYSYYESRGGKFDHTVFFGLQYILQRYLSEPFTRSDILEAEEIFGLHFGNKEIFNKNGWIDLLYQHGGFFPVEIKAVPEGTRVPVHNVLMTIENTDPQFPWLTNYLETLLSQVWYPTTVCTLSNEVRRLILGNLEKTGDPSLIDFKLHDFGFRGTSSVESAGIGGAAHLVNFLGTDTLPALMVLRDYYSASGVAGYSVPAAEHSTITSWGVENESEAYLNMVDQFGHMPFYSVVSDSYNLYEAAERIWGDELHAEVLDAAGTLVVRPDSGDPWDVVPKLLGILGRKFGYERNDKGYKVLNPKVRVIQGDGMSYSSIERTIEMMRLTNWSLDNVTFGMGGGLLQKVNRDTLKFAFKCSSAVVDGKTVDVRKTPVTDMGKMSKAGRFDNLPELQTVYLNGVVKSNQSIDSIRERAKR